MSSIEDQVDEVLSGIDKITDPKVMSLPKYLEFLDELLGGLQIRRDAAKADLRAAAQTSDVEGDGDD